MLRDFNIVCNISDYSCSYSRPDVIFLNLKLFYNYLRNSVSQNRTINITMHNIKK